MSEIEYDAIRHFADSWGLVFLLGVFAIGVLMALLPTRSFRAQSEIPFKHDDSAGRE